ncbi:MAG TPA: carbonic anhydrase [Vicinamibacteria bacterium]|nr:carbonic anhydrase [Vicinamibacteria bacterium]
MARKRPSQRTIQVVFRFGHARGGPARLPRTPKEAVARLLRGNRQFAQLLDPRGPHVPRVIPLDPGAIGYGAERGIVPVQRPYAAVLGCSDARAPVEMIFQQRSNDLFVVRVAGNGVGSGSLGSLRYAAASFPSLRLIVVLGHSQCGAVTAAVDAFLRPRSYLPLAANYPLRSIVDAILVAVRSASLALEAAHGSRVAGRPGYRAALVETSVALNACLSAYALKQELDGSSLRVLFGSYDIASRSVRLPLAPRGRATRPEIGLFPPPDDDEDLRVLAVRLAASPSIASLLRTGGDAPRH